MEKDTAKEVEVKDTKKEEEEYEEDNGDYYDDTDNYYIEKTLHQNIKDDPASVRSRPNPSISKLQITDEDKIPKMPEKILPMPLTQEEYDKKKDEYLDRLAKKKESIDKLYQQLKEEKSGIKNSKISDSQQFNDLLEKKKKLKEELEKEENKHMEKKKKLEELTAEVKKYDKMKFPTNPAAIQKEIQQIQESLSFGDLTITEEKKYNEEKLHLEAYFQALKELREYKEANKEIFKKFSEIRAKMKELNEALDPLFKKRKEEKEKKKKKEEEEKLLNKDKSDETNPVIGQIKTQIAKLKEEKKESHKEFKEFTADQNRKWKEYNDQQYLIDYINRAKKKIKDLKDRAKRQEKAAKAKAKSGEHVEGELATVIVKSKVHDKEIEICDNLISYFGKLNPKKEEESKKEETKTTQQGEKSKLDEDLSKGFLKEFKRDEQAFGTSETYVKKKKGKKPKMSKREQEHVGLVLDFDILQKLNSIKLSPPAKEEEIPKFLEELEKKKQFYLKDNVEVETPAKTESEK